MLREGYEIFVRNLDSIEQGKEIQTQVRDAQTCENMEVKAVLSSSHEALPDGKPLWMRALVGHLLDKRPWWIRITQVLEEQA